MLIIIIIIGNRDCNSCFKNKAAFMQHEEKGIHRNANGDSSCFIPVTSANANCDTGGDVRDIIINLCLKFSTEGHRNTPLSNYHNNEQPLLNRNIEDNSLVNYLLYSANLLQ